MINLTPYNSNWPTLYQQEKIVLLKHINHLINTIEHIGSTSVPKLTSKPIIDILIGVESLKIADQYIIPTITKLNYSYIAKYEKELPERRYFQRLNHQGQHTHHIHLVETTSDFYKSHLLFRDYLRAHSHVAEQYAQHKLELAPQFTDSNEYAHAKTHFIQETLKQARQWHQSAFNY
ncbi:dephospho-CoA kinase/protein folding accessory domain-containing protein [Piscirickettsia salmonis]|uniref:GrpB family protein n=1 Tax=Piscirickettsia salmonis TaxID=1238 RepID=UPI0012B98EBB|nr:GrpB family protein [Piscirickettsia salmonis]QGP48633.1 dephospho-CoA kinase/protein folding accessory domain-containing protein [Piscirickettsia salmonis]